MNKTVSIIVPCYNDEMYLQEFIDCIVNQTYRPLELCFINDGSTDKTAEIFNENQSRIEESEILVKYIYQANQGLSGAINTGLKQFSGEYLIWADSDDLLDKNNVYAKVRYLEENPNIGLVRNNANNSYNGILSYGIMSENEKSKSNIFEDILLENTNLYAGCFLMRSSLFLECYPNREIPLSRVGQNLQLLLPAASRSKCGFVDEILMTYRIHPDSMSHQTLSIYEQFKYLVDLRKLLDEIKPHCDVDSTYYEKLVDTKILNMKHAITSMLRKRNNL